MSGITLENPTLELLATEIRRLQERLEDVEDLMELRDAIVENGDKPLIPWEQVKGELYLD